MYCTLTPHVQRSVYRLLKDALPLIRKMNRVGEVEVDTKDDGFYLEVLYCMGKLDVSVLLDEISLAILSINIYQRKIPSHKIN